MTTKIEHIEMICEASLDCAIKDMESFSSKADHIQNHISQGRVMAYQHILNAIRNIKDRNLPLPNVLEEKKPEYRVYSQNYCTGDTQDIEEHDTLESAEDDFEWRTAHEPNTYHAIVLMIKEKEYNREVKVF